MAPDLGQQAKPDQLAREQLALDILRLARDTLLVNMRFLDVALCHFKFVPGGTDMIATDGLRLSYDADHVLKTYRSARETIARDYLHLVFHCLLHHPFVGPTVDRGCWDLACDIAVENAINDLGLRTVANNRPPRQTALLGELSAKLNQVTAEKVYRHYLDQRLTGQRLAEIRREFLGDDHAVWYVPPERSDDESDDESQQPSPESPDDDQLSPQDGSDGSSGDDSNRFAVSPEDIENDWKQITDRVKVDLDTASHAWGERAGALVQGLRAVTREKHDYAEFLRRFAVLDEAIQINVEEFDYVFYTYGLGLYGNMPLIEPLEYKDVHRIKEFVIAIDTSGSVSGELVQKFIQKTYNILKQTDNFFSTSNLHIIQCDAEIQEDVKITSPEDLDSYLEALEPRGFGGTDFRPVFEYVDELRRNKEFTNLRGLIYFTDGFGTFPSHKPEYDTAFVFVDDEGHTPDVPVWAIKLVLTEDEI